MPKSSYLRDRVLAAVFNGRSFGLAGDPYVSLHTAEPGMSGASEVTGGGYGRQRAAFGVAAGGTVTNLANIDFDGMPAGTTVTHVGWWDAEGGGNLLYSAPLPIARDAGDIFRLPAGRVDVSET